MKEAIGGTWLFQIVIVFILLFAGYMCLTINHSKAFSIKSEIIESLTRYGYVDSEEIKDILKKASYRTSGDCGKLGEGWQGWSRDGGKVDKNATFCTRRVDINQEPGLPITYYYQVAVFYQLDLPVFNSLFSFTVKGDTSTLYSKGEVKS